MQYIHIYWDYLREINPIPVLCHESELDADCYLMDDHEAEHIKKTLVDFYEVLAKLKAFSLYFDDLEKCQLKKLI